MVKLFALSLLVLPLITSCCQTVGDRLERGHTLQKGECLKSVNGAVTLTMQLDGNLVLYCVPGQDAIWDSHTGTKDIPQGLQFQGDGNLVLYDRGGTALWHTHTGGTTAQTFVVQTDKNVVVYGPQGALWSSDTHNFDCPVCRDDYCSTGALNNVYLHAGESLTSNNGNVKLTVEKTGNVVLTCKKRVLWQTNTHGAPIYNLVMRKTGTVQLYGITFTGPTLIWSSGTTDPNSSKSVLRVQDDGNAVVYNTAGRAVWATSTSC